MTRRVYALAAIAVMISTFAFASAVSADHKKGSEGCTPGYYKNNAAIGSGLKF